MSSAVRKYGEMSIYILISEHIFVHIDCFFNSAKGVPLVEKSKNH